MSLLRSTAAACLLLLTLIRPGLAQPSAPAMPEKPAPQAARKWRLNGLGVSYVPKRDLSFDAGYRAGLGASGDAPPQRGFFVGLKKRFETR